MGTDDGEAFTAHVEPGRAQALHTRLDSMRFIIRVNVTGELATVWRPNDCYRLIPRAELETFAEAAGPGAGTGRSEALRIARDEPRRGLDTGEKTIPNEAGWIGTAVHLDKGCYRGRRSSPGCTPSAGRHAD